MFKASLPFFLTGIISLHRAFVRDNKHKIDYGDLSILGWLNTHEFFFAVFSFTIKNNHTQLTNFTFSNQFHFSSVLAIVWGLTHAFFPDDFLYQVINGI